MTSTDVTKGNPRLPPPADATSAKPSNKKRLIVLCDGKAIQTADLLNNMTRIIKDQ